MKILVTANEYFCKSSNTILFVFLQHIQWRKHSQTFEIIRACADWLSLDQLQISNTRCNRQKTMLKMAQERRFGILNSI